MRAVLLTFLMFFSVAPGVWGQLIDNRLGTAFTEENFFDKDFVKRNKIRNIKGNVSFKREGQPVYDKDQFYYYEFDEQGRIIVMMTTFSSWSNSKDTTVVRYYYDQKGNLITKRRNDNYGFYSYNYEYDSLGRVIRESYCRDENCGPDKYHFKLGQQFVIRDETFSYVQYSPKQKVKQFRNNYGKLYQEVFSYYDDLGYHIEDVTRLTLSGKESKIKFEYDEKGRINKKSDISYIMGYNEISNTYTYDALGNLEEEGVFRNGKQTLLRSLLYDKVSLLMNAQVTKDFETGVIYITKYVYEFY